LAKKKKDSEKEVSSDKTLVNHLFTASSIIFCLKCNDIHECLSVTLMSTTPVFVEI